MMEEAKRARTVETPKQPSFHLRLRAPELYSPIPPRPARRDNGRVHLMGNASRAPSLRDNKHVAHEFGGIPGLRPRMPPNQVNSPISVVV